MLSQSFDGGSGVFVLTETDDGKGASSSHSGSGDVLSPQSASSIGDPSGQRAHSFAGPANRPPSGLLSSATALRNGLVPSLSFGSNYARENADGSSPRGGPGDELAAVAENSSPTHPTPDPAAAPVPPECEPSLNMLGSQGPSSHVATSLSGAKAASQEKLLMRKTLALSVASAAATAAAHSLGAAPPSTASMGRLLAPSPSLRPTSPRGQPPQPEQQLQPCGKRSLGRSLSVGTPGLSLRPTPPPASSPGTVPTAAGAVAAAVTVVAATSAPAVAWSRPSSAAFGGALLRPKSSTHVQFAPPPAAPDAGPSSPQEEAASSPSPDADAGSSCPQLPDLAAGGADPLRASATETGTGPSPLVGGPSPAGRPRPGHTSSSSPRPWNRGASGAASLHRPSETGLLATNAPHALSPAASSPLGSGGSPHVLPPHPPSWQRMSLSGLPVPPAAAAAAAPQQRPASAYLPPATPTAAAAAAASPASGISPTRSGALPGIVPPSPSSSPQSPGTASGGAPSPGGPDVDAAGSRERPGGGDGEGDADADADGEPRKLHVHIPAPPEVRVRVPKWLNLAAFQVTEQLRSGRLQELVDRLAAIACPTLLDLGGLEFSGAFAPPGSGPVRGVFDPSVAVPGGMFRHTTLRFGPEPSASGAAARYRHGGAIRAGVRQVLAVPPGQHVTIANATLLLTAEQYLLVGRRSSLTLKGVEILGCSREAAVASAAVRRRVVTGVAVPGSLAALQASQQQVTAAAGLVPGGAAAQAMRRTSMPGNALDPMANPLAAAGAAARRVSDATGVLGGVGGGQGALSSMPLRAPNSISGGGSALSVTFAPPPPPPIQIPGSSRIQALVDKNEYMEDHGLLEIQGGHVRISHGRLWPGRCQLALCVSEGGGCTMSYSTTGPVCAAGARSTLVCQRVTFDGGAAGGASVLHGAHAALTGCRLRFARDEGDAPPTVAAAADGGGELGLEARGAGSAAVLTDCELTRCGVGAYGGAHVHLHCVRLSYARRHGLFACDAGTALYGRDVRVEDSGAGGAAAADGATLRLADATVVGSAGPGLAVLRLPPAQPDWQARCGIPPTAAAAPPPMPPRASAALLRGSVSANAGHGAAVSDAGMLEVVDSELFNNMGSGLSAEGAAASLAAQDVRVIRNEAYGVRVAGGGGAALSRCCARANGRDGVAVEGRGSRAQLSSVESRQNRESGLCVTDGAAAELRRCRLSANQHDGLAVGGAGTAVAAAGCTLGGNVAKGAVVCMGGRAELAGCALHCNGSKSAQVSDEGSRLVLGPGCALDRQPVATNGGTLLRVEE